MNTAFNFQFSGRDSTYKPSILDEIILAMRLWQEVNFVLYFKVNLAGLPSCLMLKRVFIIYH